MLIKIPIAEKHRVHCSFVCFIDIEVRGDERLLRACFGHFVATAKTCYGYKRYSIP